MINVLFIANPAHIVQLIQRLQPDVAFRLNVTADSDQGLKQVFEKRPAVVFIQQDLDNVPCSTLAAHIKALLQNRAPRLYVLKLNHPVEYEDLSCFDGSIHLHQHANGLFDQVRQALQSVPGAPEIGRAEAEAAAPPPLAAEVEIYRPPVASAEGHPTPQAPLLPKTEEPPPLAPPAATRTFKRPTPQTDVEPAGTKPATPVTAGDDFPATLPLPAESHGVRLPVVIVVGLLLVTISYGALVYLPKRARSTAPSAPSAAPVTSPLPGTTSAPSLPSFIRAEMLDAGYASSHPGWERYLAPNVESLVYREAGRIRAVQLIARSGTGLDDGTLRLAGQALTGSADYRQSSSERRGELLLERGKIGNAEFLRYRPAGSAAAAPPKAVVIELPPGTPRS